MTTYFYERWLPQDERYVHLTHVGRDEMARDGGKLAGAAILFDGQRYVSGGLQSHPRFYIYMLQLAIDFSADNGCTALGEHNIKQNLVYLDCASFEIFGL